MSAEIGVGEAVGQQIERLQDRKTRANQGHELLVENEKPFEVELLRTAQDVAGDRQAGAARADRIDEKALLRVALAKLLFGDGGGGLLVDLATSVRVFQNPFRHG